jgi:hypothetical protein
VAEIRFRVGGDPYVRYEPDAAEGMVGMEQPLLGPGGVEVCRSRVKAAEVTEDRLGIVLTLDVPEKVAELFDSGSASYSLRPWAVER